MPYRRLPNTDKARVKAMQTALKKQEDTIEIIIPFDFRKQLEEIAQNFENRLHFKNTTQEKGVSNNKTHTENTHKSRMYLSHFMQVINMSIQRGELSNEVRSFYGIAPEDHKLPDLGTEKALLEWGKKIIDGENERMLQRGTRIYNPSLALVSINYEKFVDSYKNTRNQKNIQERANTSLYEYRPIADECILQLWNILEEYFKKNDERNFLKLCSDWGINYVYRKGELKKLEQERYVKSISPALEF
ncbi:MAG: hypothetical protein KGV44_12905 [Flavobacteriaceae bacterium]|nr:hypothetical protein [Flavobacteriaceae bacterium]